MVATADIRFKRMKREYDTLHDTQDETLDKVDGIEAAILGLNQAVTANRELIMANRELIMASTRRLDDLTEKMDRLMTHLDVPPKPPMGFMRDDAPVD